MKKLLSSLSIILIISIIFIQNSAVLPVFAGTMRIGSTKIGKLENDTALLSWYTNEKTNAVVHYGLDANNLDNTRGYYIYTTSHELKLTRLVENKTYYYKIIAKNESGESIETFVQSFSTKGMRDTIAPKFLSTHVYQTTSDAAAINWVTNERTRGAIYYGTDLENLSASKGFGYAEKSIMYIYNLKANTRYYIKIIALDKDGNQRQNILTIKTNNLLDKNVGLQIRNIKPTSFDSELVFANQVNLSWGTNLVSKGMIDYSENPNRLSSKAYSNGKDLSFEHSIILKDLKPNSTYYYRIRSYDALYNKSSVTNIMSFTTSPKQINPKDKVVEEVLGDKITEEKFGSIILDKNHRYECKEFDNLSLAEDFYYTYSRLGYDLYLMNTNGNAQICEGIRFRNSNPIKKAATNSATKYVSITTPQVLGVKITSPFVSGTDSDNDGLPDAFEAQIATDPFNPDTDGDGYDDGTEIANNYNPHGPGKIYETIYNKPRMNDDLVANKANELKYHLGQADVNLNDIGSLEWVYLLNAYVYGEYPEEAVIQAIKFGGRTVHPTVPWKFWRNSDDYNYFINR